MSCTALPACLEWQSTNNTLWGYSQKTDLPLFELLCAFDDLLELRIHQLLLEGCQLGLLCVVLLGSQLLVWQQLNSHPVLVGQQVLLYEGPKHILP